MPRRLKVLISAYSCEPGKGSEPEVGWQWALQMARFHDVTVFTRANNRVLIAPALEQLRGKQPLPEFVYHDRGEMFLALKRRFKTVLLYYLLWQRSAREVIASLHQARQFDLMHHVTFAAFRYPIAIWGHGVPTIWGPVGGIESIPRPLLPWHHPLSLVHEVTRNAHNLLQATPFHVLPRRARASTLILASTREMQKAFAHLGFEAQLMPTIGLRTQELPYRPHPPRQGPLKLLFVGNIITLKGVDLALEALKESRTQATLTFVGDGSYREAARGQVSRLLLHDRVAFLGRLPREQVLKLYSDYDVLMFPSLHDTGGYAVIEAMFNELPVICLNCGGPAIAVRENCGVKVPITRRTRIIAALASAIRNYEQNPSKVVEQGQAARQAILQHYDWDRKGEEMSACYEFAMTRATGSQKHPWRNSFSGMGGMTNMLHRMLSFRGMAVGLAGLLLIGMLGFASLSRLKGRAEEIVGDTLPGLSFAGEANANLAQAFNRSLLLVMTDNPDERARLHEEIETYGRRTSQFLNSYRRQMFTPEDEALFRDLLSTRRDYLAVRHRVFELAEKDRRTEAVALCRVELLPSYQRYKEAGDRIFEYNMKQGQERGHSIMTVCNVTRFVVAGIGVLVFVAGFFIGMFK